MGIWATSFWWDQLRDERRRRRSRLARRACDRCPLHNRESGIRRVDTGAIHVLTGIRKMARVAGAPAYVVVREEI